MSYGKCFLIGTVFFLMGHATMAQKDSIITDDSVFVNPEIPPEFPGGYQVFLQFIMDRLRFPEMVSDEAVKSKIYLQFVVDSLGDVVQEEVVRGIHPELDAEVLRVARLSPQWKPGTMFGKPVATRIVVPIIIHYR